MIAAIGLGAVVGGVLFALVLHLARPGPAPLVELGRFDAQHTHAATATQAAVEPGRSRSIGLPGVVGAWVAG